VPKTRNHFNRNFEVTPSISMLSWVTAAGDPVWAGAIPPGYPADEETYRKATRLVPTQLECE